MSYTPQAESIGYVTRQDGTVAELLGFDSWKTTGRVNGVEHDLPSLASYLAIAYDGQFRGPQYGPTGLMLLNEVAKDLDGKAVYLLPIEDPDPNVAY